MNTLRRRMMLAKPGATIADIRWLASIVGVDRWAIPEVAPWSDMDAEERRPRIVATIEMATTALYERAASHPLFGGSLVENMAQLTQASPAKPTAKPTAKPNGQQWWRTHRLQRSHDHELPAASAVQTKWESLRDWYVGHGLRASADLADPRAFWAMISAKMMLEMRGFWAQWA